MIKKIMKTIQPGTPPKLSINFEKKETLVKLIYDVTLRMYNDYLELERLFVKNNSCCCGRIQQAKTILNVIDYLSVFKDNGLSRNFLMGMKQRRLFIKNKIKKLYESRDGVAQ